MSDTCLLSFAPVACAVMPLAPIRKNANSQYSMFNILPPTAIAPIYAAEPMCPTIAVSIRPKIGVVIFDIIAGSAIARISFLNGDLIMRQSYKYIPLSTELKYLNLIFYIAIMAKFDNMIRHVIPLLFLSLSIPAMDACTSMIVSAKVSATGRPLLWKHRDTSAENNVIVRHERTDSTLAYVALYNAEDSLHKDAWVGFNEAGFAVMNTASYNLAPDTATIKDREGEVMSVALRRCKSVADFEELLGKYHRPMGVQANFGAIDAQGNGAYFETDDYEFVKYDLADSDNGVLIRTNYSESGENESGYGYIRRNNAAILLEDKIAKHDVSPSDLTDNLSCSFYHSLLDKDYANDNEGRWAIDQDFIPRYTSTASVVIEGISAGESPNLTMMWTELGYPPCSHVEPVMLDSVPENLQPGLNNCHSEFCDEVLLRKHKAFPITRGNGKHYIDMNYLRPIIIEQRRLSKEGYKQGYAERERRANK